MKPALLLAALLLVLSAGLRADTIHQENGRVIERVRVEKETYNEVTYRTTRGVTQTIPSDEVERIDYSDTSPEFSSGMNEVGTANWASGVQKLQVAAEDDGLAAHVRATALITVGDALLTNGYFADAEQAYQTLLTEYRDSRHRPAALLGRGKALIFQGRYAEADEVLKTLQSETQARGFAQVWSLEAEFLLLLSAEAQGQGGLLERYTELRMLTQGQQDGIANKAALRMARLMLAKNPPDLTRAVPLLDEIIDARLDTDRDIVAGAYVARGRVAFAKAQAALQNKDNTAAQEHLRDAVLDFLRVQVSYDQVRVEQPEALYWASQAFNLLAGLDAGGADAELHSRRLKATLLAQFPQSEWGRKAAAE